MGYLFCSPCFRREEGEDKTELDSDFDFFRRLIRMELERED